MRIVITKNGKLVVQELEEESPSNLKSKFKSFQSSSYSKLPFIHSNDDLLKKYSNKINNDFITTLLRQKNVVAKRCSNSLMNRNALKNLFNRDESKINMNEINQVKKIKFIHNKTNIGQHFLDKYDSYDDNFKKKLMDFSNYLTKNKKNKNEQKKNNNNIEINPEIDNSSNLFGNSNNLDINLNSNNLSPMDSNSGNIINNNNNNSSTFSLSKIKKINIGDIISKNNLYTLRNKISKYNIGPNDSRIPLDKYNLRSFNFRSKYENRQATEDDMDLILNYGINSDKESIIKYFQQNRNISPHYFENLLKYDETQLYKLNKICEKIIKDEEEGKNIKKWKFFTNVKDEYRKDEDFRNIGDIIKKTDNMINDYTKTIQSRNYWKLKAYKEDIEIVKRKYWEKYDVDRFLKKNQKKGINLYPLSSKNIGSKKLFSSQSSPNIL